MLEAIAFDADDTLWHTEHYYRETERSFLKLMESYNVSQDEALSVLHSIEINNLAFFGYGIRGFTFSMIEAAIQTTGGQVRGMDVNEDTLTAGAALFGVDPRSLQARGGSDGAVYSCRRGDTACMIKFVPLPPDRLTVYQEKLDFIFYLAENGVPVALPQPSENGQRYEMLPGMDSCYAVTVTPLAGGRHPTPRNLYDWNERLFVGWGQVLGKMHALARAYPRWQKVSASEDNALDEAGAPSQTGDWRNEYEFFSNWCEEPKIVAQWRKLYEPLSALPRERDGFGLIHNDLHMWNFLYNPDARGVHPITIIDFDVCCYHWFITDIAIAVYHGMVFDLHRSLAQRETFARQFLQPFMRGYRQENQLNPGWFEHLPLFLRYREILSYIALSKDWPEARRATWQNAILAEKRARILRDEPLIRML